MARILIGWELGGNSGHTVKLTAIAGVLAARGHEIVLAVQDVGGVPPEWPAWQAPLWPAQLATRSRSAAVTPATMGDILCVLGLDDADAMRGLLRAWENILRAAAPDIILAEFAPGLMMAARGRLPVLALGTGFSLPPAHLPLFASLTGRPAVEDEGRLLGLLNGALIAAGRRPLDRLTAIFAADRELVAAFRETDPYREWRLSGHGTPSVMRADAPGEATGDELFVYMNGLQRWPPGFWQGIADARLDTRIYAPRLSEADARVLEGAGLIVERRAVPFALIAQRSRLVLSHGGLGLASSALLAGLPTMHVPFDIEKRMVAASFVDMDLGVRLDIEHVAAARLTDLIRTTHADDALAGRVQAAAPGFRARAATPCEMETAAVAEAMLAA